MKFKLIMITGLLTVSFFTTTAQQRRTVEERVQATMSRLSENASFNDSQKASLDSVFTDYYTSMNKLREGLAQGARPDSSSMQKIRDERDTRLKTYMTQDQFQKFKDDEDKMRRERMQRQGGNN